MKKADRKISFIKTALAISIALFFIIPSSAVITNKTVEEHDQVVVNTSFGRVISDDESSTFSTLDEEIIQFDDDIFPINGGLEMDFGFEAAIRITPDELASYDGWELVAVYFICVAQTSSSGGNVKIYSSGTQYEPGALITNEPFTATDLNWYRVDLSSPVELNVAEDIWISLEGAINIPFDYGPAVQNKGDWLYRSCTGWKELRVTDDGSGGFFDCNWKLRAIVSDGETEFDVDAGGLYTGVVDQDIDFTGSASGGLLPYKIWSWDFGDGNSSNEQNPTYTYEEVGTYTVRLTVEDQIGTTEYDETTATVSEPSGLEIVDITSGIGKISAEIKNTGNNNVETVEWCIEVEGGLLKTLEIRSEGEIDTLKADDSETVCTDKFIFGFGTIEIKVTAEIENVEKVIAEATGFLLGPFLLVSN